jgi:hypothetical protein
VTVHQNSVVRRNLGDRRLRPRFDIVGEMWGTLETVMPQSLRSVGRGGMLIECRVALPLQSIHRLLFRADGEDVAIDVRVQHVRPNGTVRDEPRFLVGLEFLSAHPALMARIDQWLLESQGDAMTVEA